MSQPTFKTNQTARIAIQPPAIFIPLQKRTKAIPILGILLAESVFQEEIVQPIDQMKDFHINFIIFEKSSFTKQVWLSLLQLNILLK